MSRTRSQQVSTDCDNSRGLVNPSEAWTLAKPGRRKLRLAIPSPGLHSASMLRGGWGGGALLAIGDEVSSSLYLLKWLTPFILLVSLIKSLGDYREPFC